MGNILGFLLPECCWIGLKDWSIQIAIQFGISKRSKKFDLVLGIFSCLIVIGFGLDCQSKKIDRLIHSNVLFVIKNLINTNLQIVS